MYTPEQRVRSLSRREISVIYLTCRGFSLHQIANEIGRNLKTVQHYRTKAYKKLELTGYPDDQKITYLQRDYCPIVFKLIKTPEDVTYWIPSDIETGQPLSIIKVEDDEDVEEQKLGLVPYGDTRIIPREEKKPPPPPPPEEEEERRPYWLYALLAMSAVAIVYLLTRNPPASEPVPQTLPPEFITVIVTNTPEPVVETEVIVIPPTSTLEPTNTRTPLPTDTPRPTLTPTELPLFFDAFSGGKSDLWQTVYGNPIIVNNALTFGEDTLMFLDEDWTDYELSFDMSNNYCQGAVTSRGVTIGLRVQDTNNMVALRILHWRYCGGTWFEIRNGEENEIPNTRFEMQPADSQGKRHIELSVKGNNFDTTFGIPFVLEGFPNGGISLLADEGVILDNFKVELLP